ncbi:hypothetical protein ACFP3Q_04105 [Nocardioides sp. GCM10027113]|uniref:hypothetical protein n=1 Tax=unclassified Nocardioides TaxID=2615069 RepID=UPI00361798ED
MTRELRGDVNGDRWRDTGFLGAAQRWVDGQLDRHGLARTGPVDQVHVRPWSTVIRVPVADGSVWFKANEEALRHEAAVVDLLSRLCPAAVPPLLAHDPARGWMLMPDAGESLRQVVPRERSLCRWHDVLTLCAQVQVAAADAVPELLEVGVPDMRLATLPDRYDVLVDDIGAERRFRESSSLVRDLADELASSRVPETIQHDDLHDAQVFVRDGRHLIMDWGDACVSHPFFTLAVTLEGNVGWGLDDVERSEDLAPYVETYLAPFAERYDVEVRDLAREAEVAMRLGWACRAVNGHVPGEDGPTLTRLRMLVDRTPGG